MASDCSKIKGYFRELAGIFAGIFFIGIRGEWHAFRVARLQLLENFITGRPDVTLTRETNYARTSKP